MTAPLIYSITAPDFNGGIMFHDGMPVAGTHNLAFMHGWTIWQVIKYCDHRGWILEQTK